MADERDADRTAAEYQAMAEAYAADAELHPVNASYERPQILEMAGDVRDRRILDAGCAAGGLTARLAERGAKVVGVDIAPSLIEIARSRLGSRAEFQVADLARPLPFLADSSFDLVTASLVLHYLRDWGPPLGEFHRILRPDGRLLISTHHPMRDVDIVTPPAPYFDTVLLTDTWRKAGHSFEVRFYHRPLRAIVEALSDAGFCIERMPEPIPDASSFSEHASLVAEMRRRPWFLFVRAVKR